MKGRYHEMQVKADKTCMFSVCEGVLTVNFWTFLLFTDPATHVSIPFR